MFLRSLPPLALGYEVMCGMHAHFVENDMSLTAVRRTLQAATLAHFQRQPLAHLCAGEPLALHLVRREGRIAPSGEEDLDWRQTKPMRGSKS